MGVRALKYGTFVKPGDTMRVEVSLHKDEGEGLYAMKGEARVVTRGGERVRRTCASPGGS